MRQSRKHLLRSLSAAAALATGSCDTGPAAPRATSMRVLPTSATLTSIGDTVAFSAIITDQYGNPFDGPVAWQSSQASVFVVATDGVVTAARNGSGTLTATYGGRGTGPDSETGASLSATAAVRVVQVAASAEAVEGDGQTTWRGGALPNDVVVRVTDAGGTPVARVQVAFAPASGDGSADPATTATDSRGRARTSWTLGNRTGRQQLEAAVPQGPSAQISATAVTPEESADTLRVVAGDGQSVLRGRTLRDSVVALVLDDHGRPVPGARVGFSAARRNGRARPDTALTGDDGRAKTAWTLGAQPGPQNLTATVVRAGGPSAQIAATALTPEEIVATIRILAGNSQAGTIGERLPDLIVAQVLDSAGAPVARARVAFGTEAYVLYGAAFPDTVESGDDGRVSTVWELGYLEGDSQYLVASVVSRGECTAESWGRWCAEAEATGTSPPKMSVAAAYLVQAVQDVARSVPLVAGRQARLRVFALADRPATARFRPRAVFYQNGRVLHTARMEPSSATLPTKMDEGDEDQSFDATVPGAFVRPGLQMVVEINPGGAVPVAEGSVTRFPAEGKADVRVHEVPALNTMLVPVHFASDSNSGPNADVSEWTEEIAAYREDGILSYVRNVLPIGAMTAWVRQPYVTGADKLQDGAWALLSEISALRHVEGRPGQHYHGLWAVPRVASNAERWHVGGIAYVPGLSAITRTHNSDGARRSPDRVAGTFAHELGHNMSLLHAPCGGPDFLDLRFPYSNGGVGLHGYSFARGGEVRGVLKPANYYDLMSYCGPEWISDYHFKKAMSYRRGLAAQRLELADGRLALADGPRALADRPIALADRPAPVGRQLASRTLLLWGRVHEGRLRLEPAFVVDAPAKLPESPGPYVLAGLAADGRTLFQLRFSPEPVDHGGAGFLFAVPFEDAWTDLLDRIELAGPEGLVALDRATGGRAAMLLDPATGLVRSIARDWPGTGGGAATAPFGGPTRIEVRRGLPR